MLASGIRIFRISVTLNKESSNDDRISEEAAVCP